MMSFRVEWCHSCTKSPKTPYRMMSHKSRMTSSKTLHLNNIIIQCRMTSHRVIWRHPKTQNLTILPTKSIWHHPNTAWQKHFL